MNIEQRSENIFTYKDTNSRKCPGRRNDELKERRTEGWTDAILQDTYGAPKNIFGFNEQMITKWLKA